MEYKCTFLKYAISLGTSMCDNLFLQNTECVYYKLIQNLIHILEIKNSKYNVTFFPGHNL